MSNTYPSSNQSNASLGAQIGNAGYAFGQADPAAGTIKITPAMIDSLKTSVMAFLIVETFLASMCCVWVYSFKSLVFQLVGPGFLFTYSLMALWILSHMWKEFTTKIAVMN